MTVFARFADNFPERAELRTLSLVNKSTGRELERVHLDELYCADPECDCRRVLIHVLDHRTDVLAAIVYAFDGSARLTPDGENPYLEPAADQSPMAEAYFGHVQRLLETDRAYAARLERHYEEMKVAVAAPDHPLRHQVVEDRRLMAAFAEAMVREGRIVPTRPGTGTRAENRAKRKRNKNRLGPKRSR